MVGVSRFVGCKTGACFSAQADDAVTADDFSGIGTGLPSRWLEGPHVVLTRLRDVRGESRLSAKPARAHEILVWRPETMLGELVRMLAAAGLVLTRAEKDSR